MDTYSTTGKHMCTEILAGQVTTTAWDYRHKIDSSCHYAYQYDDIGNRQSAVEPNGAFTYAANALNQYTQLNRTIEQSEQSNNFSSRFFYDGYLMIQQLDHDSPYAVQKEFIWDPTEPVATKPFVFRQNGMDSTYLTHDGNKNVADVIRAAPYNDSVGHYEYAPFGAVTSVVGIRAEDNPLRFSSEYADDAVGCVCFNYRHYVPIVGRWLTRDPIMNTFSYSYICNRFVGCDYLGWHSGETADVLGIQIKDDWACLIEQYREQIAKWLNVSSVAHPFKITGTWDGEIPLDCCPAKTNSGASGKGGSK